MAGRKVLVVTNMWPGDATPYAGIFVARQVEALRAAAPDWTFDVFVMAGRRGRKDYLLAVPRLRRALRTGYDLVHAHYGFTGTTAALAGARPLITTLHGGDVNLAWQRPFTWPGVAASKRVIAVSERLRDTWGDPGMPVIACGVPTDLFRPHGRDRARRTLGISDASRVVLFPADPKVPVKDYPLFREALQRLPDDLRGSVVERSLGDVPPPEVPQHMAASDVVVLTSRHEAGPVVVKEALASGIRVVAVDVGDAAPTLAGVPGTWVTSRRPEAIAAAIAHALLDPPIEHEVEQRRQRVFDFELDDPAVARRVLEVYEEVLAETARR